MQEAHASQREVLEPRWQQDTQASAQAPIYIASSIIS